jgi:hypothetical protein
LDFRFWILDFALSNPSYNPKSKIQNLKSWRALCEAIVTNGVAVDWAICGGLGSARPGAGYGGDD